MDQSIRKRKTADEFDRAAYVDGNKEVEATQPTNAGKVSAKRNEDDKRTRSLASQPAR